jgi:GAF domain-containing protein
VEQRTSAFEAYWSFGIDLEKYDLQRALGDAGLRQMMGGEYYVSADRSDVSGRAQAFIPIRLANETVAIVAILRLLPHKHAFDKWDVELFKILSNEAGAALFGPSAHSKTLATGRG